MRGRDPLLSDGRRQARRLILVALALALVLAGCGGGGGPRVETPVNTTGRGGSTRPTVTVPPNTDPAVSIHVGGPSLLSPGPGPALVSFGEVAVGATSAPRVVRLESLESYAVTVVNVRIEGDPSFQLQDDRCSGSMLQPQGSGGCMFAVGFSPQREGPVVGGVVVTMTHTCTAVTYEPCSWDPDRRGAFTREVSANGQVVFSWRSKSYRLDGTGAS